MLIMIVSVAAAAGFGFAAALPYPLLAALALIYAATIQILSRRHSPLAPLRRRHQGSAAPPSACTPSSASAAPGSHR